MADNFELMSSALPIDSKEEKEWLEKYLRIVTCDETTYHDGYVTCLELEHLKEEVKALGGLDGAIDQIKYNWEEEMSCPDVSFIDKDTKLWIKSEDGFCTLDSLACLIQIFLKKFNKGPFGMGWAGACSKPRIGEFGGAAVVIFQHKIEWWSTWDWVEQMILNGG